MTIDEARSVLEYHEPSLTYDEPPEIRLALKLGIEALIFLNTLRTEAEILSYRLLPGETIK